MYVLMAYSLQKAMDILHYYTYTVLCNHDTQLMIVLYAETSDGSLFRALK